jgi:prephenate dehydrogenase
VGLGLIGGSLGLALRALKRPVEVIGVTRTADRASAAKQRGAVDSASADISVLEGADVVVIATPIEEIRNTMHRLRPHLSRDAVVTDVASVKQPVIEWSQSLPNPSRFLGGHPVAGKTQTGLEASDASIFVDEPWIFTPAQDQDLSPFEPWLDLVRAIGARPTFLSPHDHDRQMAYLSHLAFTLSAAYAESVERNADVSLGGPGYRGMVRLASGDPAMYESISRENARRLVEAIDHFTRVLGGYRDRIDRGEGVRELFEAGHVAV